MLIRIKIIPSQPAGNISAVESNPSIAGPNKKDLGKKRSRVGFFSVAFSNSSHHSAHGSLGIINQK